MAKKRGEADPRFFVEIGSERFDPKDEGAKARRRANSDKKRLAGALNVIPEAIPGTERELWLVQFAEAPDLGTIGRFRADYGLRLTAGLTSIAFIEQMTAATAGRVRRQSRVRACIPYWSELKRARSSLVQLEEIAGERLLRLGLVEDATESLLQKLDLLGFEPVGPATAYPGGFVLRVKVGKTSDAEALLLLNEVEWVEDIRGYLPTNASSSAVVQGGGVGGSTHIWDKDLHGEGQIIGVLDTDLPDMDHDFFRDPDVTVPGPTHRKVLAIRTQAGSPTDFHPTRVCGCAVGDDVKAPGGHAHRGGAWAAKLVYTDINPYISGRLGEELLKSAALEARVHNMSVLEPLADGTKPAPYTDDSASVDHELWRNEDLLLVSAVANTAPCRNDPFLGAPGTAKNPVTVAGTKDVPNQDQFHTGRPGTADGRRKPDLVAVGDDVISSTLTTHTTPPSSVLTPACGTSYAAPHVAAAAALVRQYFTEGWYPNGKMEGKRRAITPSGALLKAVLLNATVDIAVPGYPSAKEGWGRLQLDKTLHFEGDKLLLTISDERHIVGLAEGYTRIHPLTVPANAKSLRITLVFNDPAGAVGAKDPVINKLDIVVFEPQNTFNVTKWFGYFGNDLQNKVSRRRNPFAPGQKAPPDPRELKNNVRQVLVNEPMKGRWAIYVVAHKVDQAATPSVPVFPLFKRQGYALVALVELK
jgi:hypothetical protein